MLTVAYTLLFPAKREELVLLFSVNNKDTKEAQKTEVEHSPCFMNMKNQTSFKMSNFTDILTLPFAFSMQFGAEWE